MWERAPPRKGAKLPAGFQRLILFRRSELRIRDAVQWWCLPGPLKPSLAAVSLALPGQTAPSRHHHCPAHFTAEPPRVSSTLSERRQDLSISKGAPGSGGPVQDRVWPGKAKAVRRPAEPCMFNTDEQLRLSTSYRGGRLSLEAVLTDLVCRVAPRLITNLEEYQEAGLAGLRIARSRQYQVRGRGTGGYCGIDVDARGRV